MPSVFEITRVAQEDIGRRIARGQPYNGIWTESVGRGYWAEVVARSFGFGVDKDAQDAIDGG